MIIISTEKYSEDNDDLKISTSNYMQVDDQKAGVEGDAHSLVSIIHEAFAGDEVTREFEEEKALENDKKMKQVSEAVLPGKLHTYIHPGYRIHMHLALCTSGW